MFPSHHYTNDSSDILSKHFFNAGATVVPNGRSPSFDDDILPDFILQQPLPDIIADPNTSFKHYTSLDNLNGLLVEDFACAGKKSHGGGGMRSEKPDTALLRPKKSLKRDRHSKINTAQGPRDRRMRLSLEIARKFFDLQDVLGFDKPSKTVEWLLRNSRAAIEELSSGGLHSPAGAGASSTSEEAVSSIDIENIAELAKTTAALTAAAKPKPSSSSPAAGAFGGGARDKRTKLRKTTSRLPTRESRARARARARARTNYAAAAAAAAAATPTPTSTSKGGTAGTLIQNNINPNFAAEVEEIPWNSCTTTEAIFGTDCPALGPKWSSSQTIFNFTAGSISHEASSKGEVLEQWEDTLHRDHTGNCTKTEMPNFSTNHFVQQQFGDCFQFYGKPWEAYNAPL